MSILYKQGDKHCGPRSDCSCQTALTGAVLSGFTMFIYEASNSLVDDQKRTFCDNAL